MIDMRYIQFKVQCKYLMVRPLLNKSVVKNHSALTSIALTYKGRNNNSLLKTRKLYRSTYMLPRLP